MIYSKENGPGRLSKLNEEMRIRATYAKREMENKSELYSWRHLNAIYMDYRVRAAWALSFRYAEIQDLTGRDFLDVGCGRGGWLKMLLEWGGEPSRLHGIDLLEDRVARARAISPAGMDLQVGKASSLPYQDHSMHLCAASTLFSSMLDASARLAVAAEMVRVLAPGGWIMVFDYAVSHPRNPDTIGIGQREIIRCFPGLRLERSFKLLFAPPLLRLFPTKLFGLAQLMEDLLPFLCTHRLYLFQKGHE